MRDVFENSKVYAPRSARPSRSSEVVEFSRVPAQNPLHHEFLFVGNISNPANLHIMVHGGNSDFENSIPSAVSLHRKKPEDLIVLPNARWRNKKQQDKRFWSRASVQLHNQQKIPDWLELKQAAQKFKADFMAPLSDAFGVGYERFSLTGFSQGTAFGHYVCEQTQLGAFVAQSGSLPEDIQYSTDAFTPMLVISGAKDELEEAYQLMQFSRSQGRLKRMYNQCAEGAPEFRHFLDMGHTTTSQSRECAAQFIFDAMK